MTSAPRTLTVAALLVLATALAGCGDDTDDRADSAPSASAPVWATPAESTPPAAPSVTPSPGATPSGPPRTGRPTPPVTSEARPSRTPQFVMPTRSAGAPGARQVMDAFRAAKLPVSGVRDRSVDCGPNGAGLGCAELLVTDTVSVYVFPDEANAVNRADMWGADAYRKGTVVLSYLGTTTSTEQRRRYEAVLADLG